MLPSPASARFQPLRSGLINLFKYQDQEFWYERGRLLVRGNNGTGKSRVLALQLPFLLDGEISPRRVEPDGDPARQIAWHLLMDEHEQRTGYTWIEFGRRDETGLEHFVTLGCGMRAVRGGDNQPTRWFFITDKRVGRDFPLLQGSHPLSADRLADFIGKDALYTHGPREYRLAIDKRLFGLGEERYKALIELLIRLRAPQLAKKLNADLLFSALSDALPPLSSSVVANVASAFKDLDDLRTQHENLKKLSRALALFHAGYRDYLQTALLRRAKVLRSRHVDFESAQRAVTEIERALEAAKLAETEAASAVVRAKETFAAADAAQQALQQSDRAADAGKLDYAKQAADSALQRSDHAATHANAARHRLATLDNDISAHAETLRLHAATLSDTARDARDAAAPAGFAKEHAKLIPAAHDWPADTAQLAKIKTAHAKAAHDHFHRLEQIQAGLNRLADAQANLAKAQQNEDRLSATLDEHRAAITAHDEAAQTASRLLAETYAAWQTTLRWLSPPPWSTLAPVLDDWLETADEIHRTLATILAETSRAEATRLATLRSDLQVRLAALAAEQQQLRAEQTALDAGPPPPPVPPATRDAASRQGRPGAPLWQVCEFQPHLAPAQRAGLEAALESAGLLDAWITPDGALLGDLPADTFLATSADMPAPHVPGPTLADWLSPDLPENTTPAIAPATLRAVLARIHAGPSVSAACWVGLDGAWRLGPLFGRGRKDTAVHLGATGREAARQHRLVQIAEALAALALREAELAAESASLSTREVETETERRAAPKDNDIAHHLTLRTAARDQFNTASLAHAAAVRETHRSRQAVHAADEKLKTDARDLGYDAHLHRLAELRPAWEPYSLGIARLWGDAQAWTTSQTHAEQLAARRRMDDETATAATDEEEKARLAAVRAQENYQTLARTLGASIEEYQRELQSARKNRDDAQTALDAANSHLTATTSARSGFEAALPPAKAKVADADTHRASATLDLRVPLHHGLFTEAHPDLFDIETDDWSPTRAYVIARRLDKDLPQTDLSDNAWTGRLNNLNTQINDLRTHTGALGCQIVSHVLGEGLTGVTCHYQGSPLTPAQCLAAVERERETHERLLNDGERDIIDRHLVTEVSLQLQTLINDARDRTDEMNSEMTRCATTLGVTLRLAWEPVAEGLPAGLPHIRKLLLADHAAWSNDERDTVGRFLHQLIQEERARDPASPATEQLQRALDYRRWHAFAADRRQNNRWERLTRKRYGTGSGGEKALMLTIPQMAAASSHYKTAAGHAPRLILLDEAFAGMDKPTRARCMGLLEAFDLDLLMTSEREWGAHATVSGIAIYQLVANAEAVLATRWVWNGVKTQSAPVPDTPEGRATLTPQPPGTDDELPLG